MRWTDGGRTHTGSSKGTPHDVRVQRWDPAHQVVERQVELPARTGARTNQTGRTQLPQYDFGVTHAKLDSLANPVGIVPLSRLCPNRMSLSVHTYTVSQGGTCRRNGSKQQPYTY